MSLLQYLRQKLPTSEQTGISPRAVKAANTAVSEVKSGKECTVTPSFKISAKRRNYAIYIFTWVAFTVHK